MPASTRDRPRLLLIDGHSVAYRAFFALPVENFSTTTGQPTNAVYGFTSMLINVLRDEAPTHLAVAFDLSRVSFRTEVYPAYKANRAQSPADFNGQISLIQDVLRALSVPSVTAEGYEADDVIATLATQAESLGMDVLICTGDRDAYQLVSPAVTVLYPRKGVSDLARMTPDAVVEKYGLTPEQYPDFAALRGDPSDNLPSIPGVGEKTAVKWITTFGSLPALVDRVDEVPGKAGDALRANLSNVLRNRTLTELVRTVDLTVAPLDLARQDWDRDAVHEIFDALQFRVLRERLYATLTTEEPEADQGFAVEARILGPGEVAEWLATYASGPARVGVQVRGTWGRGTGDVAGLALAGTDRAGLPAGAYIDLGSLSAADEAPLAAWLADPTVAKAVHDLKGPLLALRARGLEVNGVTSDTALAAYLALPGQRSFDLGDLALRYLSRELRGEGSEADSGQLSLDGSSESDDALAEVIKSQAVAELAEAFDGELERRAATKLLADLELPLVRTLAAMESTGIAVDEHHLTQLRDTYAYEVADAAQRAYDSVGHEFNLGSPKQLQVVLFEELNLPKTKKIKTGFTTDAEALQGLALVSDHPLLEALLRHRDVTRLRTVVESLLPMVDAQGRIHTTFNQMVAATGRLSSTDPNLQNIPIRTAEGRRIREGFVVGSGFESLLTADYSQIEMRILAHLSEDADLIDAFTSGEDLHTTTAARVFNVEPHLVDADLRRRIKAMSYGLAYGLSAFGLSQQLKITPEEARAQMDAYFQRFGGVRDYLAEVVDRARAEGYTETIFGRRRYLPDLTSDNVARRQMAERMALNAPIQGSAADIIKFAMLGVDRALAAAGLRSRMLLQVHDELVFEVAPGERDEVEALVRAEMAGAATLRLPLDVSVGHGRTWDEAGH